MMDYGLSSALERTQIQRLKRPQSCQIKKDFNSIKRKENSKNETTLLDKMKDFSLNNFVGKPPKFPKTAQKRQNYHYRDQNKINLPQINNINFGNQNAADNNNLNTHGNMKMNMNIFDSNANNCLVLFSF